MKKVVIDARMVGPIPHGISKFVTSIAQGLAQQKLQNGGLPYELHFLVSQETPTIPFQDFKTTLLHSPFLNLKELFEIPKFLKAEKADLYHSPSFSSLWTCPCPSIVTIHDLNHLQFGNLQQKLYYRFLLRPFALRSKKITTVSEFSKHEIAEWLSLSPQKIEVTYNAIEPSVGGDLFQQHGLKSGQFFFCLSNSKPHKNLELLVHAYRQFRMKTPEAWPLVISVDSITKFFDEPGIRTLGSLSEPLVKSLLSHTAGLFFPSLYEGFGLPPVEAAASGVRVVASCIPPHQEGLVDLPSHEVLWVEPQSLEGWTQAFQQIFRSEILPPSPTSQQKILERFSVQKLGRHIDQLYQQVLGLGSG